MSTLYLDCFSGISGDMVIGALIHAGADPMILEKELKKLNIEEEYQLKWQEVNKNGITAVKFDVLITEKAGGSHHHEHSEDASDYHGHSHDHHNEGEHSHIHDHLHDDGHEHEHHHHEHSHHHHGQRNYQEIVRMIEGSDLTGHVKSMAIKIFTIIGEAEGRIHGVPLERVHFHEVGAVDSIVDIVGTAILIDQLNITEVKSAQVPLGKGKIHIDHGIYPVPAPATLEILKGIPVYAGEVDGELTTPTGAAIAASLANEFTSIPAMKIQSIGYGAGTKTFKDHPNVLRALIGD